MKKGLFIIIAWVSGSWKNTTLDLLTQRNPQFKEIVSYTSRPIRENEKQGINYNYISLEQFQQWIDAWYFLEYAKNHNTNYYGTKNSDLEWLLNQWYIVFKEMSVQWIEQIMRNHKDLSERTFSIFLDLSEETMVRRITSRAPTPTEEVERRIMSAKTERVLAKEYCNRVISAEWTIEEVYNEVLHLVNEFIHQHNNK